MLSPGSSPKLSKHSTPLNWQLRIPIPSLNPMVIPSASLTAIQHPSQQQAWGSTIQLGLSDSATPGQTRRPGGSAQPNTASSGTDDTRCAPTRGLKPSPFPLQEEHTQVRGSLEVTPSQHRKHLYPSKTTLWVQILFLSPLSLGILVDIKWTWASHKEVSWAALSRGCQQAKGGELCLLHSTWEATPGVLGPILGSTV